MFAFILKGYKKLSVAIDNIIESSEDKKKIKFNANEPVKKKKIKEVKSQTKIKSKKWKNNNFRPKTQPKTIELNNTDSLEQKMDIKNQNDALI